MLSYLSNHIFSFMIINKTIIEIQALLKPIVHLFFGQIMASYLNQVPALIFFLPHGLLFTQVTGNNTEEQNYLMQPESVKTLQLYLPCSMVFNWPNI